MERKYTTLIPAAIGLGLLLNMGTGCAYKLSSGRTATALASIGMEPNEMLVRPTEVLWSVGGELRYETSVMAAELAMEISPTGVFFGGPQGPRVLPQYVRLAAARAVVEQDADGVLLTHYLVEEIIDDAGDLRYDVHLFGRLLGLSTLGTIEGERADDLEGLEDKLDALRGDRGDDRARDRRDKAPVTTTPAAPPALPAPPPPAPPSGAPLPEPASGG